MQSNVTTVAKLYAFSLPRFFFVFFFSRSIIGNIVDIVLLSLSLWRNSLLDNMGKQFCGCECGYYYCFFFSHVEEQSHARRTRFNALPRTSHFFFLANVTVEIFHWNRKRNFFYFFFFIVYIFFFSFVLVSSFLAFFPNVQKTKQYGQFRIFLLLKKRDK